jgi:hypothetical protein
MAALGSRLVDLGYNILPIRPGTKYPGNFTQGEWRPYSGWQKHGIRPTTLIEAASWSRWPDCAIGIATGNVVAIDIDIVEDAAIALAVEALAREMLGDSPCLRIGMAPKRLLVYRATTAFGGIKEYYPIEILARGQQFVAYALHPETGRPYEWPNEGLADTHIGELPAITEDQARAFGEAAYALVPTSLRRTRLVANGEGEKRERIVTGRLRGTAEAIRSALEFLPNDDAIWDDWVRIGLAVKGAIGDAGCDIFCRWSAKSKKDEPAYTLKTWRGFGAIHSAGAGTIYYLAENAGWVCPAELTMDGEAIMLEPGNHPAQLLLDQARPVSPGSDVPSVIAPGEENIFVPDAFRKQLPQGFISEFVEHTLASAIHPQPIFAVGAALAAVGVLAGRRYRSMTNVRTNLYICAIGESGAGKDHARGVITTLFLQAGLSRFIGGNKLVSGSGLLTALYRSPSSLFQIDEFGRFLKHVTNPRMSSKFVAEIWDNLTELSTSAHRPFAGGEYANQQDNPRKDIMQPCCVMHATTVPKHFWDALRGGSADDGSLARWLLFPTDDPVPERNRAPRDITAIGDDLLDFSNSIVRGAAAWQPPALGEGPSVDPCPHMVLYTNSANDRIEELADDVFAKRREAIGNGHGAILARWHENIIRVALTCAISREPANPEINIADVEWAETIVNFCIKAMTEGVDKHVSENDKETELKKVLSIIAGSGKSGITQNDITRRTQSLDGRRRMEILRDLMEGDQIRLDEQKTNGRTLRIYRPC